MVNPCRDDRFYGTDLQSEPLELEPLPVSAARIRAIHRFAVHWYKLPTAVSISFDAWREFPPMAKE